MFIRWNKLVKVYRDFPEWCSRKQGLPVAGKGAVYTMCCQDACMHKVPIQPTYIDGFVYTVKPLI